MSPDKSSIAVVTDSTCNIPTELVKQHNIYIVSQHLIWGTEDLLDLKDIDASGFYERLPRDPVHPKTSQPPASEFADVINRAKADGAKQVLLMTVSAPLSGTHASAQQSVALVDIPVETYDSRSAGMGLGWQVLAAARAGEAGADVQGMIAAAKKARETLQMLLVVDTLEYLHKGGRIGAAQKLIGTALNLKPRLRINPESGIIEPVERTRTRSKAVEGMYQAYFDKMDRSKPMRVAVHHAAAPKDGQELVERIRREFNPAEIVMTELTPVLGTHVGPGCLALTGYYEQ
jgi:DegV family protein with EDD domain